MVAIVTGNGLGLSGSSASVLGAGGQIGNAATGLGPDGAYVNAQTGNLVISRQDELLIGLGPDIGIVRTYNSNGTFDFDNNDNWQISLYRRVFGLPVGWVSRTVPSSARRQMGPNSPTPTMPPRAPPPTRCTSTKTVLAATIA